MFSWFKNSFIPHEGNNHRPHFLHGSTARILVALLLVFEVLGFVLPTLTFVGIANLSSGIGLASVLPAVLGDLTNKEREDNNLSDLKTSDLLNKAAQMKADDMAAKGYFAHTSPEGLTPWHWLDAVGYNYNYAGENLAVNFTDSEDVTKAWMNSPTHRANIVKANYTEVGTGVATGKYEGKETIFIAQVYANPVTSALIPITREQNNPEVTKAVIKTVTSTAILGAETATNIPETVSSPAPVQAAIASVPIAESHTPSFIGKVMASPNNSFNVVLYVFLGFMILVLLLNIFIKINVQHPDLITNGMAVIAIIGILFVGNNYISKKNIAISDSINYSSSHVISEQSI